MKITKKNNYGFESRSPVLKMLKCELEDKDKECLLLSPASHEKILPSAVSPAFHPPIYKRDVLKKFAMVAKIKSHRMGPLRTGSLPLGPSGPKISKGIVGSPSIRKSQKA